MTITVVVPAYCRHDDLRRSLDALAMQTLTADEVIVVRRGADAQTAALLASSAWPTSPLRSVITAEAGVVQALNSGLAEVRTEIVAITDDDAAPHRDSTQRIVGRFDEDPQIGSVGGREFVHIGNVLQDGRARTVGKIPSVGKHVGNHHLGFGIARGVDMLKGVNCSYRTAVLRPIGFDTRLRGTGAQVHGEIGLGFAIRRAGWRLVYDPAITVDHFRAPRFDEDQRQGFNPLATENAAFNEALLRLEYLSVGRVMFLLLAILVGTRYSPGVIQWFRLVGRERGAAAPRVAAAIRGRIFAWNQTWRKAGSPTLRQRMPMAR